MEEIELKFMIKIILSIILVIAGVLNIKDKKYTLLYCIILVFIWFIILTGILN